MGKHAAPAPEESVSVNVVPLVDIMFLLLLFLMVGGDMSHRETAELQLPLADKASEAKPDEDNYVVVNVHPIRDPATDAERLNPDFLNVANWQFSIAGVSYKDYWELVDKLKEVAMRKVEETPIPGTKDKYLSAVTVTIRADRSAPYGMIQQAMQACSEALLYKIEVGAAKPPT